MSLGEIIAGPTPKAYYRLESDGTDSSGNGKTLTANNSPTFGAGRFNGGVDFGSTGTNKGVTASIDILGSVPNEAEISFWFKLNNTSSGNTNARFFSLNRTNLTWTSVYNFSGSNIVVRSLISRLTTNSIADITIPADTNWHFVRSIKIGSEVLQSVDNSQLVNGGGVGALGNPGVNQFGIGNQVALNQQAWAVIDEVIVRTPNNSGQENFRYYTQAKGRFCI
jgi:hypothetical protein